MRKKICVCLILVALATLAVGFALPQPLWAQGALENPQSSSFQSGIGLISGWACDASQIDIVVDEAAVLEAAYGTSREDTRSICGDADNGFGLLFNWNLSGDGQHTVRALADGVEFGSATFTVTTLGAEFLSGVSATCTVADFPQTGNSVTLRWQESMQNFVVAGADIATGGNGPTGITEGLYIGTTSQRSICGPTVFRDETSCDVRLNIESIGPGEYELSPNSLVDFLTNTQCAGPGIGEDIAFMVVVRCNEDFVATYRQCGSLPLTNGSFEFVGSEDSGVIVSGVCSNGICSGTISERSPLDPVCTHSTVSWTATAAEG